MAVSGKTASPIEWPYALGTDKPPDMAAVSKAQADRAHALLNGFALSNLAHGTAGQLIVVQSTGAAAYKALKGDATIAEDGTLTIGNDKITAAKIAENAVGSPEIAEGAVGPSEIAGANNASVTGEELPTPTRRVHSLAGTTKTVQTIGTGASGQLVTYVNTSSTVTFKTGGNLRLASEFAAGVSDSITFAYILNLSQWCEVCRSNNT